MHEILKEAIRNYVKNYGLIAYPCKHGTKIPAVKGRFELNETFSPKNRLWMYTLSYGILCGRKLNQGGYLVVIDCDGKWSEKEKRHKKGVSNYIEIIRQLKKDGIDLENTLTVQTPNNGRHYYYSTDYPIKTSHFSEEAKRFGDIDILGTNGVVIGPQSIIYTDEAMNKKGAYTVLADKPIAPLPQIILDFIKEEEQKEDTKSLFISSSIPDKEDVQKKEQDHLLILLRIAADRKRFDDYGEWIKLGLALKASNYKIEDWLYLSIKDQSVEEAQEKWKGMKPEDIGRPYLEKIARQIDPTFRTKVEITDKAFVTKVLLYYGDTLRYCDQKGFCLYADSYWRMGVNQQEIYELIWATAEMFSFDVDDVYRSYKYSEEKSKLSDEDNRTVQFLKNAKARYSCANGIRNAIEVLKGFSSISVTLEDFDNNNIIALENGVYNLDEHKFAAHSPKAMNASCVPYPFDKNEQCCLWEKFLNDVFEGNRELIDYIQKAVGYSITNSIKEQKIFFAFGPLGANGKSTFFSTIALLCGDSSKTISAEVLMEGRSREAAEQLSQLANTRFVRTSEIKRGGKFDESLLKAITGGHNEAIRCRGMYKSSYEYYPRFKLWIFGNDKPRVSELGDAFWRRFILIPFNHVFAEADQDKDFAMKLEMELPGIFNWAIEGLKKYQVEGLNTPDFMKAEIEKYKREENRILEYIETYFIINPTSQVVYKEVYHRYRIFCSNEGTHPYSKKNFSRQLDVFKSSHGIQIVNGTGNRKMISGLEWQKDIEDILTNEYMDKVGKVLAEEDD